MEIKYTNTFRHFMAFIIYNFFHKPLNYILIGIFIVFNVILCNRAMPENIGLVIKLFSLFLMTAAFLVLFLLFIFIMIMIGIRPKSNKGFLTEHTLIANAKEFIEETKVNRTVSKWDGIIKIKRSAGYIFVYVAQEGAHVIPGSAFGSYKEFTDFYQKLCRFKEKSNN